MPDYRLAFEAECAQSGPPFHLLFDCLLLLSLHLLYLPQQHSLLILNRAQEILEGMQLIIPTLSIHLFMGVSTIPRPISIEVHPLARPIQSVSHLQDSCRFHSVTIQIPSQQPASIINITSYHFIHLVSQQLQGSGTAFEIECLAQQSRILGSDTIPFNVEPIISLQPQGGWVNRTYSCPFESLPFGGVEEQLGGGETEGWSQPSNDGIIRSFCQHQVGSGVGEQFGCVLGVAVVLFSSGGSEPHWASHVLLDDLGYPELLKFRDQFALEISSALAPLGEVVVELSAGETLSERGLPPQLLVQLFHVLKLRKSKIQLLGSFIIAGLELHKLVLQFHLVVLGEEKLGFVPFPLAFVEFLHLGQILIHPLDLLSALFQLLTFGQEQLGVPVVLCGRQMQLEFQGGYLVWGWGGGGRGWGEGDG